MNPEREAIHVPVKRQYGIPKAFDDPQKFICSGQGRVYKHMIITNSRAVVNPVSKLLKLENTMKQIRYLDGIKVPLIPNALRMTFGPKHMRIGPLLFGIATADREIMFVNSKTINKSNRFLMKQYRRIGKYSRAGNFAQYLIMCKVLLTSKSYLLAIMHAVDAGILSNKMAKIMKIVRSVTRLHFPHFSTQLEYVRRWIDKKPGDKARPLGAPILKWKIFTKMILHILEIYYRNNGTIQRWQYAGISKRGLPKASERLYRLIKSVWVNYIYEFDIRGFFDQVKNQNVCEDQGEPFNNWLNQVANAKPTKYELPEPNENKQLLESNRRALSIRYKPEYKESAKTFVFSQETINVMKYGRPEGKLEPPEDMEYKEVPPKISKAEEFARFNAWLDSGTSRPYRSMGMVRKLAMEHNEKVRQYKGRERDRLKGLGRPGHGFPQGLNLSPFLSCLVLHKEIKEMSGLLMFMDDGIIYGNSKEQVERRINRLKNHLKNQGLTLAEDKCRYAREGTRYVDLKFLGIRYYEGKMISETRSGKRVEFTGVKDLKEVERLIIENNLSSSERRIARWLHRKVINIDDAFEWAIKQGFFANLIDKGFNPEMSEEREELIRKGRETMKHKYMGRKGLYYLLKSETKSINPDYSLSTLANLRVMKAMRRARRGKRILNF